MRYIDHNGTKISKLSLGTVQFGLKYGVLNQIGQPSVEVSSSILNYVYNNGVNTYDTAMVYGNSQDIIGNALKQYSKKYIMSKITSVDFENNLFFYIDEMLKILRIEALYVLFLHGGDLLNSWGVKESQKVKKLKKEHKINYFGVSIYTDTEFCMAVNNEDIDVIQIPFNIFDQRAIHKDWIKKAKKNVKLLVIRSVFLQGLFFANNNQIPNNIYSVKKYIDRLNTYAQDKQISISSLALSSILLLYRSSEL